MESLNADFFQDFTKIIKSFVLSSYIGIRLKLVFSKFTKFPVAIVRGGKDQAFLAYHVITGSMKNVTWWVKYPLPKSQKL